MASPDLREELVCPICLNIFSDPITLRCGHNFCRDCIDQALDTQDESGVYSCPECRAEFQDRPSLMRNIALHNVVERLLSIQSHQEEVTGICCTYCVESPVPAVKSCLQCEASLCDKHLKVHSKEAKHVLTDPSTSMKNLELYCTKDDACVCVSCSLARGLQLKVKLTEVQKILISKREKTEERVQSLEEHWRNAQEKASGEVERVTAVFIGIRRRLDDLEKRVLSEISRQEEQMSLSLSDVLQKLEIKKDELSRKMRHIEELCNMTDPLTVLQDPDKGDLCDPEEGGGDEDTGGHDKTHDVDVDVITGMLHAGFSDIATYLQTISLTKPKEIKPQSPRVHSLPSHTQVSSVSGTEYGGNDVIVKIGAVEEEVKDADKGESCEWEFADILLDVNTAGNNILISDDLKTASWTKMTQVCPKTAERFQYYQVMSSRGFSSGRHYWDVEISGSSWSWRVGMCYPSIDRVGDQSYIGCNNKSWCLCGGQVCNNQFSLRHDNEVIRSSEIMSRARSRVRIDLDYEAGKLNFYELCDPTRHLCTFNATFTEPLHGALYVWEGSIKILGEGSSCEETSS